MTGPGDAAARREIAKRVLKRIDSPQLSATQVDVFEKSPFEEFSLELRRWASEPVDYLRLLDQIEDYERTGSSDSSRAIAGCYDVVRWSPQTEVEEAGRIAQYPLPQRQCARGLDCGLPQSVAARSAVLPTGRQRKYCRSERLRAPATRSTVCRSCSIRTHETWRIGLGGSWRSRIRHRGLERARDVLQPRICPLPRPQTVAWSTVAGFACGAPKPMPTVNPN